MPRPGRYKRNDDFTKFVLTYEIDLKGRKLSFTELAGFLKMVGMKISDVAVADICERLCGEEGRRELNDIELKILREVYTRFKQKSPYWHPKPEEYEKTVGVHFDPPSQGGFRPLFPWLRFWVGGNFTLALKGEWLDTALRGESPRLLRLLG